jgi:glucosamine--fructose-6-phosphate aminotransferase (isomerizing)
MEQIMEQPAAISRALNLGGRIDKDGNIKLGGLDQNVEKMMSINNLVMAACGTSYYASLYGAQLMRSLQAFETVQPVDASELTSDFMPRQKSGVLLVSQSGETKDVHRALQLAQSLSVPTLSVVNAVGSLIARSTKCGVYTNAGREHAVASTKAFVTQVTVMALIAAWFSQKRSPIDKSGRHSQLVEALHDLPTYTRLALKTRDQVKGIATKLAKEKTEHMFILGKGYAEPIAREGALKIKEITYVHAEGFPGGALKHGPFALIEEGTPVILMILDDQNAGLMNTAAQEVRARGAYTIVITDNDKVVDKKAANELVKIPSNGPLTALLATVPLQLLAYELAVAKGISPDMPRNLAKSVTVD